MFNSLTGIITYKRGSDIRLQTGGIEWEMSIPSTDLGILPPENEEGRVWTWMLHRDDQMKLFGFASESRRETFLELLKVEGIGAKGAIKIMGGITQDDMERALESGDLARLEAVPGLGKKTAQKMLLAMKGKLVRQDDTSAALTPYADIAEALADMGYDRKNINAALTKANAALTGKEKDRDAEVFRLAISYLTGN
ncbi:MAG: Holliday junction branch migration protein RuvA [Spirochaetaceae bacterium]|jgi:Holliday junction DNA helicase RuvA|nr:Holliday junction branch migration protein RuvA [Spirochaetaceae bacterium]